MDGTFQQDPGTGDARRRTPRLSDGVTAGSLISSSIHMCAKRPCFQVKSKARGRHCRTCWRSSWDKRRPCREMTLQKFQTTSAAMSHGLDRLAGGFPLSNRLIREMHNILLSSGRGSRQRPGEFIREAVSQTTWRWRNAATDQCEVRETPPSPCRIRIAWARLSGFSTRPMQRASSILAMRGRTRPRAVGETNSARPILLDGKWTV